MVLSLFIQSETQVAFCYRGMHSMEKMTHKKHPHILPGLASTTKPPIRSQQGTCVKKTHLNHRKLFRVTQPVTEKGLSHVGEKKKSRLKLSGVTLSLRHWSPRNGPRGGVGNLVLRNPCSKAIQAVLDLPRQFLSLSKTLTPCSSPFLAALR